MSTLTRLAITFGGALALSLVLMPLTIRVGATIGFVSKPRLFGRSDDLIPTLGGLTVGLVAAGAFTLAWGLTAGFGALLAGALGVVALGVTDDRYAKFPLSPKLRLLVQVAIAVVAWLSGLRADSGGPLGAVGTVLFLVAAMNVFNLLDNMDGVAASTAAATSAGIGAVALMGGQYMVASLAAAICGACLGFLPFNFKKARLYLGNAGSLLIGFLIGGAALKLRLPLDYPWTLLALIAIMGVPITDTALIIISRFMYSRPVMQGGVDHLSHRLVKLGLSTSDAALLHGGAALIGAGSVAQAVLNLWPQLIALTIGLFACVGLALLRVDVYEGETIGSARRFVVGVALLGVVLAFSTATPVLAAIQ